MTWKPQHVLEFVPNIGKCLDARLKTEKYIIAYNALLGVHKGVNIKQTLENLSIKFRQKDCGWSIAFDYQP